MDSMIYNPLEEYENKFKNLHLDKTTTFFEELTKKLQFLVNNSHDITKN